MRHPRILAAVLVAGAVTLAACGSTSPNGPNPAPGATGATGSGPSSNVPKYEVTTHHVDGLGTVLADGPGFTLYLFAPDKRSSTSTCYGICAVAWPPLLVPEGVPGPVAGHGVKASLLGTTVRKDGSRQVTYNGWPLYLWPNDTSPGQATGQGIDNVGGLWFVLGPNGQAIH